MKKIISTINLIIILIMGTSSIFAETDKTVNVDVRSVDNTDLICTVVVYRQVGTNWVYHYSASGTSVRSFSFRFSINKDATFKIVVTLKNRDNFVSSMVYSLLVPNPIKISILHDPARINFSSII